MGKGQLVRASIAGIVSLGVAVLGPASAWAANMWFQQAILLVHVPVGGGVFFTTNHVFAANQGPSTINVKCFNDTSQRVGPEAGVNVELNATGQLSQQTPGTLAVLSDPLFAGIGWCWANNVPNNNDFNVQTTIGATSDLSPGGILNSPASTQIGTDTGLAETSSNIGGIPFFTTDGGAITFALLVNPLTVNRNITLQLFNAAGVPQGAPLVRSLNSRDLDILSIPGSFGLPAPPTTGSVRITADGNGYLGWTVQIYPASNTLVFTAIGLDGDDDSPLVRLDAP